MKSPALCLGAVLLSSITALSIADDNAPRAWMQHVRIGAYGLSPQNASRIPAEAQASDVFGIEVDNDIPGRYESFLDPTEKLQAIRTVAEEAHKLGNHAFVYIAGTECITANADSSPHSMAKDHPDWLQRKITGEPAKFTSGAAFWIAKGDEDVWISPYAAPWRATYMQRVRQIAATGIDGIYVDIPYWMTHFEGWEGSWASFDDATVAAFRQKTGLDARHDLRLGDFEDPHFREWIDFRIDTITDFLKEIRSNAVAVKPKIAVIPEIYPGIEQEAVRVGADVYEIYPHVDAIAHEYEFGGGEDHTAASRSPFDWFMYQIGMRSFRAFAGSKPTWILNYSWDGQAGVRPADAMKNLASSELMAGANVWDAPGHQMAGSNDLATRKQIFSWIAQYDDVLNSPRTPIASTGVYFSPKSRDYYPDEFLSAYRGVLLLLLQQHIQFQVVTPRTLADFHGKTLVLPDVRVLDAAEKSSISGYLDSGGHLLITGTDATGFNARAGLRRFTSGPGKAYLTLAAGDLHAAPSSASTEFLAQLAGVDDISIQAPPLTVAHLMNVHGTPHIYIANFDGLIPGKAAVPSPATGIVIRTPMREGHTMHFLPFLGAPTELTGSRSGNGMVFRLSPVERGAIAWLDR